MIKVCEQKYNFKAEIYVDGMKSSVATHEIRNIYEHIQTAKIDIVLYDIMSVLLNSYNQTNDIFRYENVFSDKVIEIPMSCSCFMKPIYFAWNTSNSKLDTETQYILLSNLYFEIDNKKKFFDFEVKGGICGSNRSLKTSFHEVEFNVRDDCLFSGFAVTFQFKFSENDWMEFEKDPSCNIFHLIFPLKRAIFLKRNDTIQATFWRKTYVSSCFGDFQWSFSKPFQSSVFGYQKIA